MNLKTDVAVVGGGPCGAVAARVAAESGANVLLIDDNPFKRSVQCTGLLSRRALLEAGVSDDVVLREIKGAFIHSSNFKVMIGGRRTEAFVIQRDSFDCHLLDKAISRGIEVIETKALGLKENRLLTSDFCIEAKVIIGADGPKSNVAKWAGLPTPQKYLHGVQVTTPYRSEREDFVEVFLSKDIVPDFFAWAVPAGEGMARIGLATANRDEAPRLLKKFLRRLGVDLNLKITKGVIPIGPPARTVAGRVMIVGDAAGQAKPTSGGGIYTGIFCAKIAGEVAAKCALGDTNPLEYEIRWRKALGRELGFGMKAHNIFCKLSDNTIDKILSLLCDPAVQKIIVEHGDIDYPSILVKKLAKVPRFWSKLVEIVPSSFIDFLI